MSKWKKRGIILMIVLSLAVGAGGVGFLLGKNSGNILKEEADAAEAATQNDRIVVNCEIKKTIYFSMCGHTYEQTEQVPKELVGLNLEELKEELGSEWNIDDFSAAAISLSCTPAEYCDAHWILKRTSRGIACLQFDRDTLTMKELVVYPGIRADAELEKELSSGIVFSEQKDLKGFLWEHWKITFPENKTQDSKTNGQSEQEGNDNDGTD